MVFTWINLAMLVFLVAGFAFAAGPVVGSLLLSPHYTKGDVGMSYECGMPPHGTSWVRFGINYYIYALIFLAFDVDVLYLFPVAAHYPDAEGFVPLVKVFIFLAVLALGVAYFWRKGVFTWPRRISE
ncbi:NADH-quinone oxidoreductase subunit A [Desulfohalovibrio reitneri]|uniref:NADH-quinone oxidoreductase subunit A n=1 Tax=Desulfohalovibrio reitneri TaxID=1307759 RepID=UPI0004A6E6C2|nr:NADH-quinone oxidoreductase subunit A [Desulfohalovibrio reitneri]